MKAFVITIMKMRESYDCAQRCIRSGAKYGIDIIPFSAITPSDGPVKLLRREGIDSEPFTNNEYSKDLNAMSCFLSHYHLWKRCANGDEPYMILEHDAVFTAPLPTLMFDKVVSVGAPSFGSFNTPTTLGVGPLVSKRYFPGAHAYLVNPRGAKELVDQAKVTAAPTDVFLHIGTFPWLQECYPWVAEVRDTFTTVQVQRGCEAKHSYRKSAADYKIMDIK